MIRACSLAASLKSHREKLIDSILRVLSSTLRPNHPRKPQEVFSPTDHCAVLKCLLLLPRDVVENRLGETEMAIIMGGLQHQDQTIRRQVRGLWSSS